MKLIRKKNIGMRGRIKDAEIKQELRYSYKYKIGKPDKFKQCLQFHPYIFWREVKCRTGKSEINLIDGYQVTGYRLQVSACACISIFRMGLKSHAEICDRADSGT